MTALARAGGFAADPAPFVRTEKGAKEIELAVLGARCASCLRKIESGVGALEGVQSARLNLSTGRMRIRWTGDLAPTRITQTLAGLGYQAVAFDPDTAKAEIDREGRRLLACLAVAGFAAGNVMMFSIGLWTASIADMELVTRTFLHWASAAIALPASAYAGRPFFFSAWRALRAGRANMDVPISLAVVLSLAMSLYEVITHGHHAYFDAAVSLLFFLLIGRYLDHQLRYRANEAGRLLLSAQATGARRIGPDGTIAPVLARQLQIGDRILLVPGDRVPTNATIETGTSDFDLSLLTGESAPVALGPGAAIHGGALNVSARIVARTTGRAEESLAAELARLIEAGTQSRARYVRLADRAAALYVPVIHGVAAATLLGWWLIAGAPFQDALMTATAVLIITCPCALGLAVPAVQIAACGRLFRQGVLVKSGDGLERLSEIDTIVFDKTGTLTLAMPTRAREPLDERTLARAAQLARLSHHPLAMALAAAAGPGPVAQSAEEMPGEGILGIIDGLQARLGSRAFVTGEDGPREGMETWFRLGDAGAVRIAFEDRPRSDARETVQGLIARGYRVAMLTGDAVPAARRIAEELGIAEWMAAQTPAGKIDFLHKLKAEGRRVLMVGDGLNDAPSLAQAHASISPGTAADASHAAADFVIQGERLGAIVEALRVARMARRRILENFAFSALYNVCALPIAILGFVTPLIAAIAMSSSSLIVSLNALRISFAKARP